MNVSKDNWCWLGFHKFSKWDEGYIKKMFLEGSPPGDRPIATDLIQRRACEHCNKIQFRRTGC